MEGKEPFGLRRIRWLKHSCTFCRNSEDTVKPWPLSTTSSIVSKVSKERQVTDEDTYSFRYIDNIVMEESLERYIKEVKCANKRKIGM